MAALWVLITLVPRAAHADTPPGVVCQTINGVYTCTDSSIIGTQTCVTDTDTGQQACETIGVGGASQPTVGQQLGRGLGVVKAVVRQASSSGWLSKLTGWIANTVQQLFIAISQFCKDLVTYAIGAVLDVFAAAIASLSPPDFLSQYSLGNLLGQTGSIVGFFMSELRIPAGLGLIAAGYAFRLLRKFLTLFQW